MAGELVPRVKAETGKMILRAAYRTELEDPQNHLAEVNAFAREGGSIILYGNHIAFDDPVSAMLVYERFLDPRRQRHIVIPASHWHTDPENNPNFYRAAKAAELFFGAEIYRLIQNHMVNKEPYNYTQQEADDNHRSFFFRLKSLKREGIPTDLLIYPEGHRSEDGVMGPVEEGMTLAGGLLRPCVYVPLGVHYEGSFMRDTLNVRPTGRSPHLVIGTPIFQTDRKAPPMKDLMHNLAATLPPPMRGPYA